MGADHQQNPLQPRRQPGQRQLPTCSSEQPLRLEQAPQSGRISESHLAEVELHFHMPLGQQLPDTAQKHALRVTVELPDQTHDQRALVLSTFDGATGPQAKVIRIKLPHSLPLPWMDLMMQEQETTRHWLHYTTTNRSPATLLDSRAVA